jgi:hypothetical protein
VLISEWHSLHSGGGVDPGLLAIIKDDAILVVLNVPASDAAGDNRRGGE